MQSYTNMTGYPPPAQRDQHSISYEDILRQVEAVDWQNKKLISIADNIMKTSFLRHYDQTPEVITQLEEDMKMSFNTLIESIR